MRRNSRLPKSADSTYIAAVVNNRKEVIQCLIVNRRGRRHPWAGSLPLRGSARS